MKSLLTLLVSHLVVAIVGFGIGIYALPILTAPPAPAASEVREAAANTQYSAQFRRSLEGSDTVHWGDGTVFVGPKAISLEGRIAPGPDYKLYLSPEFVKTKAEFIRLKPSMKRVGEVKTFENFIVPIDDSIDLDSFNTVIVWCEAFSQFITAAQYR